MEAIGFKNFRKFADFPTMDLAPITILVGANNAGKSTVVKGILAFSDFINNRSLYSVGQTQMDNDVDEEEEDCDENHDEAKRQFKNIEFFFNSSYLAHIGTFKRALCYRASEEKIGFFVKKDGTTVKIWVEGNRKDEESVSGNVSMIELYDDKNKIDVTFDFAGELISLSFHPCPDYQPTRVFRRRGDISEARREIKDPLVEYFGSFNKTYTLTLPISFAGGRNGIGPSLFSLVNSLEKNLQEKLGEASISEEKMADVVVKPEEEVHVCSIHHMDDEMVRFLMLYSTCWAVTFPLGRRFYLPIKHRLRLMDVEYIYAHAVTQSALYSAKDTNDYMSNTIHEFVTLAHNSKPKRDFVKKWMKEFGIGKDYTIRSVGGEAHLVYVTNNDGEKVPLADKGMGSIQLMVLLFRLATIMPQVILSRTWLSNTTIIIEEPEQNLHPMLQSKLADMFYEINREYGFRFIVETHSEYLIRKTQVLVKEFYHHYHTLEGNPFKIYYFNSENDQPYYEIEYQKDGCFANDFGKGFFDEASSLALEIL